ncbi:hypothetical protein ACI2OX_11490 [Bacillus sp. N9]
MNVYVVDQRKPIWVKEAIDKVMEHKQRGGMSSFLLMSVTDVF